MSKARQLITVPRRILTVGKQSAGEQVQKLELWVQLIGTEIGTASVAISRVAP